jgi:hypothetical protein
MSKGFGFFCLVFILAWLVFWTVAILALILNVFGAYFGWFGSFEFCHGGVIAASAATA